MRNFTYLQLFARWCDERALTGPEEITRPIVERFQHHLYLRRKKNGQPLSFSSQAVHLTAVDVLPLADARRAH